MSAGFDGRVVGDVVFLRRGMFMGCMVLEERFD